MMFGLCHSLQKPKRYSGNSKFEFRTFGAPKFRRILEKMGNLGFRNTLKTGAHAINQPQNAKAWEITWIFLQRNLRNSN